nr:MAG TPA: hypothetical protein [Caudoviricetes sp.]
MHQQKMRKKQADKRNEKETVGENTMCETFKMTEKG